MHRAVLTCFQVKILAKMFLVPGLHKVDGVLRFILLGSDSYAGVICAEVDAGTFVVGRRNGAWIDFESGGVGRAAIDRDGADGSFDSYFVPGTPYLQMADEKPRNHQSTKHHEDDACSYDPQNPPKGVASALRLGRLHGGLRQADGAGQKSPLLLVRIPTGECFPEQVA